MDADLLRQRRNLIAISAILTVFDFAKVRIAKISILGTELLIGNAEALMICAWTLWAYFLLRYYQYWIAERDECIRDAFKEKLDKYARSHTKAISFQDAYGQVFDDYKISRTSFATWTYTLQGGYDPSEGKVKEKFSKNLSTWRLVNWSIKSAVFVCVHTPHATNHILPFGLAFAAPIITLSTRYKLL
jgi:hypothetical protein